jgi:two-component system, LytTR family, response regulator
MIRALIIDDEPLARKALSRLLKLESDIEIAGECDDGENALMLIRRLRPDLLFLDVRMPELDGFEVVEALDVADMPAIVFVTAYDQHALRAFEVHAVDYLLKPFSKERLAKALIRVRERIGHDIDADTLREMLNELRRQEAQRKHLQRIPVTLGGRIHLLSTTEIERIEALGNYAQLISGDRRFEVRETLLSLEKKLDPTRFVRIHRSTIVNLDFVKEVQSWFKGGHLVIMKDGSELRLSRYQRGAIEVLTGKG